jgi:hypothetical protein
VVVTSVALVLGAPLLLSVPGAILVLVAPIAIVGSILPAVEVVTSASALRLGGRGYRPSSSPAFPPPGLGSPGPASLSAMTSRVFIDPLLGR